MIQGESRSGYTDCYQYDLRTGGKRAVDREPRTTNNSKFRHMDQFQSLL